MFTNWKIKDLTLLGFSVPTVLMVVFSLMVYANSHQTRETLKQVNIAQIAIDGENEMVIAGLNMHRRLQRYVIDPQLYQDAIGEYAKHQQEFQTGLEKAKSVVKDSKQQARIDRMLELYNQYNSLKDDTVRRASSGTNKNELIKVFNDTRDLVDEFTKISDEFNQYEKENLQRSITATQSSIDLLTLAALTVSILSLSVVVIANFLITKFLGNRIAKTVEAAEKISSGDLTQSVIEGTSNSKDEIGQLLNAFQNMTHNLSSLIQQVQQSGIQVTSSATQIAASGKQLETSITEQVASTNQVTVAAKEISATSKELVKTVEEVAALSQATTVAASDSQKDLLQMETTMRQLVEATNSIAARLGVISEKANNINNIVVTITKVADQTNLLSLNAAIEAEKAGEYGLGFAVVAREIRRLADQTAVATIDIEQMVKQMQSSVSTGVMEMDKFAAEVGKSVEDVADISSQIGQIIEQVQELTPRYEAVSQGMEAQSQGAIQISDAMSQLSSNSVQTAASLREINQAITKLNQVAQGLRQEMSRFKVNNAGEQYVSNSNKLMGEN
ncbi:methyl-accepting chemotaxis protein [Anabaena sphaerica FACHB-251]|uniref:Methyl-accepting chemotaxis protein n=1 Tax=Anabaena sphaerica FACHB-251 TaxID=2692883 RepID=A0A926WEI4_9NOST|nr:methyl-accepting chemotaxis protein [Anabaena sphaerica]MBD2292697.1 methyl-accepting chemotaxis protein [Anabaena sphaerica FACHB-251]